MISNLSIGALNNGWLVCLNTIIADYNDSNPMFQVNPLPNGIINGNWIVATNYLIDEINVSLELTGMTVIPKLTIASINNGWQYAVQNLVSNINASVPVVPTVPYSLTNATFNSGTLHWTGGTISANGGTFNGCYLEYPQVPDGEVMTITVPALVGTIDLIEILMSNAPLSPSGSSGEVLVSVIQTNSSLSMSATGISAGSIPAINVGDVIKAQRSGNHMIISVNNAVVGNTSDVVGADASYMYIISGQGGSDNLVADVVATVS